MPSTLSPNMSLILPTVGQEPGPNWAFDLNNSLSLVDQHNHTAGSGVQITPAGLDINTDLSLQGNNLTSVKSTRYVSQLSPLAGGADIGCVYVSGSDLYYNDTVGNQVRLTIAGAVNGTPGSIGGLVAPATVTYVPANQAYVFQSNVNTSGSLDSGPIIIRNNTALSNGITLSPPTPLPANYTLTLFSTTPASKKIVTLDSLGNLAADYDVDNSTLTITSNTLKVANSGITQTQLANNSVGTNQIIDSNVTTNKIADGNVTVQKLSSTTLLEDTNAQTSMSYSVPPSPSNFYININSTIYTKTFNGVAGRPILFNTRKSTSNAQNMTLYWVLTVPTNCNLIFGGFGFPGPPIQGWISVLFNGVEIIRTGYRQMPNGNYNTASPPTPALTYSTTFEPITLILVPSATGSQTIEVKINAIGTIYGNGSLNWDAYMVDTTFQTITY